MDGQLGWGLETFQAEGKPGGNGILWSQWASALGKVERGLQDFCFGHCLGRNGFGRAGSYRILSWGERGAKFIPALSVECPG